MELGEKGECLLHLAEGHFLIPDGFIIKSNAYLRYVNNIHLDHFLQRFKHLENNFTYEDAEEMSKMIQELFIVDEFPYEIENEISIVLDQLLQNPSIQNPLLAIRSSPTLGNAKTATTKPPYRSILNVSTSMSSVIQAILDCWKSLFSAEALMYRKENKMHVFNYSISLILQIMIPSQVSGVVYSCNPYTFSCDHALLNCIAGLGDPLMREEVAYDSFVVQKHDVNNTEWDNLLIVDRLIGDQSFALYSNYPEPGTTHVSLHDRSKEANLKDEQVCDFKIYSNYSRFIILLNMPLILSDITILPWK